jgi:two-component system sensor histidine kinase YesM
MDTEISIFLEDPELLTKNNYWYIALDKTPNNIMESLKQKNTSSLVLSPREFTARGSTTLQKKYYTVVHSVAGRNPEQGILGLVTARIEASGIHKIIRDISVGQDSYVYLRDGSDIFFVLQGSLELEVPPIGLDLQSLQGDYIDFDGERYTILRSRSSKTDWELIALINENFYLGAARNTAVMALLIALLFILLAGGIAVRYFDRITRWLEELGARMKLAAGGNYDTLAASGGDQEIQAIHQSYNTMISTIKSLIEDHYQQQIKLQIYELKALENQIKPHFLYNTLDVIKFKALRSGASEVAANLDEMARYFRLVLARGARTLTLLDVTEQSRLYVKLQNYRFGNTITFETDIPEETAFCTILRFLLQPLVENAIVHGIRDKPNHTGKVSVIARKEGDFLTIRVIDDGVGMTRELLASLPGNSKESFGIFNIHSRIQVFYGAVYGLSFPWSNETGTCAELRLPYIPDKSYLDEDTDPAEMEPEDTNISL